MLYLDDLSQRLDIKLRHIVVKAIAYNEADKAGGNQRGRR